MNESIYDLIPPEPAHYERPPRHQSKFNKKGDRSASATAPPPSYSTFPCKTDPVQRDSTAAMLFAGRSGVIGRDVGASVDPRQFLKKHTGAKPLPPVATFHRSQESTPKRTPVPAVADKPVMGLMTEKNFVHSNAVDVICSAPKRQGHANPRAVDLPEFGRVPSYLQSVKQQVDAEKSAAESYRAQEVADTASSAQQQLSRQLPEEERVGLLDKLRSRYDEKHRAFQALPFSRAQDQNFIVKKEAMERELKEMEAAIEKLSKKVVVVYYDAHPGYATYARGLAQTKAQTLASASP